MPRFLVADCLEFWRRLERSPLCRDGVEIVMARGCRELARRASEERFDAVLVEEGTPEASELSRELGSSAAGGSLAAHLVLWPPAADAAEVARGLGLECRRRPRSRRVLWVEVSGAAGFRARTKDASPEGMFLLGAADLPQGARLAATLRLAGGREEARAALVVVRRVREPEESHWMSGLGVRVEPAAPADAGRLERWLAAREGEA